MKTNLPSITAPIYRDKLPSNEQEFTYRPFLVREEKLLQLIKDDGDIPQIYESLKQLIKNCTRIDSERNLSLKMRYPKYQDVIKLENSQDFDSMLSVLISCTEMIIEGDEIYETRNFSEIELKDFFLQLNLQHVEKIKSFFSTMPKICYNLEWTCTKCGRKESHVIEGVQSFLS